jgi:hypothetical protein
LILTIIILSYTYQIKEFTSRKFSFEDSKVNNANISVEIDEDMSEPVYLYIYFINFHQNHRIYLKSKSKSQLADKTDDSLSDSCSPLYKKTDLDLDNPKGLDGNVLDPCGLAPRSFMNITISATRLNKTDSTQSTNKTDSTQSYEYISMTTKDISWNTDDEDKYKNSDNGFEVEDERFKNWMRTSATKNLRKLYYKIKNNLDKGDKLTFTLTLDTSSIYYDYRPDMKLILSTTTRIGGKNKVLGFVFLVITILSLIWSILFTCLEFNHSCKNRLSKLQGS